MGWSGGSEVAKAVITATMQGVAARRLEVEPAVARTVRKEIYAALIRSLWNRDWDTEDEVRGIDDAFDEALDEANEKLKRRRDADW
jgi:hypothetical protein